MDKIKVLNLYACLGGYRDVLRNLVDYEAGRTIFETALGIENKSNEKQTSIFDILWKHRGRIFKTNNQIVMESIIRELKLTKEQVLQIVNEWYTCWMCLDIFQNENGEDLEEYLEQNLNE